MSPIRLVAVAFLLLSIAATGMLVYQHFSGAAIPGCAPGAGCSQAAASAWGRVPGTSIPVSIVGLAYYVAALIAFVHARGEVGLLRWMVRLGVLGSLLYIVVMFTNFGDYFCEYCLAGHLGHFAFWGVMEWSLRKPERQGAAVQSPAVPLSVGVGAFALVAAGLIAAHTVQQRGIEETAQRDFDESMRQIEEGGGGDRGFVGRYVRGPENAPARIVMFTDYHCPECKRVKEQVKEVLEKRDDVSFSVKHYPLDAACNRFLSRSLHDGACWTARIIEAAGILGGTEGYWKMHDWIIDRGGHVSEPMLNYALPQLGFRPSEFMDVVRSQETLDRVRADIEEANELGAFGTPMVFINGVELRGRRAADALERAVVQAIESDAAAGSFEDDRPPSAFQKHIDDWRFGAEANIPPLAPTRTMGNSNGVVVIDAWGDFADAKVAEFHAQVKLLLAGGNDVQYTLRHFPMDQSCNEHAPNTTNRNGCAAARAAEAAAQLGGAEAHLAMIDWLFSVRSSFTVDRLRAAAADMGLDPDLLVQHMARQDVDAVVRSEAAGAKATNIRWIPHVFVNGRLLPRWQLEGHDVLGAVADAAAAEAGADE